MNDQDKRFKAALELETTEEILRRRALHAEVVADPNLLRHPIMQDHSAAALVVIDLVLRERADANG